MSEAGLARAAGRWVRRNRLRIALAALAMYVALVPVTIIVFPDSNLWVGLIVLAASATQALLQVADLLDDD